MLINLSAEHIAALDAVLNKPASKIIFLRPELSLDKVTKELNLLIDFVKNNSHDVGHNDFVIKLFCNCKDIKKESELDVTYIISCIQKDKLLINTTFGLKPFFSEAITSLDNEAMSEISCNCVIAHIESGQYIHLWVDGRYAKEIDVFNIEAKPRMNTKLCRSAEDYKLLVYDHYKYNVKYAQSTDHWYNRPKRILRSEPRKTEFIFHKDLWLWLDKHASGCTVFAEVEKLTPDRTDIELITTKGKKYVLEIKWLGVNQSGTSYTEERICKGIKQIEEYLERDKKILIASLIVYNALPKENYNKVIEASYSYNDEWCELKAWDQKEVPTRGTCYIFYLDSETASS